MNYCRGTWFETLDRAFITSDDANLWRKDSPTTAKMPMILHTPSTNISPKKALTYVHYPSNLYASGVLFFRQLRATLISTHITKLLPFYHLAAPPNQERRAIEKPCFLCCGTDLHDASRSSQCWWLGLGSIFCCLSARDTEDSDRWLYLDKEVYFKMMAYKLILETITFLGQNFKKS